jgi:lipopolysaccharide/colanic/teichoic acid biosynthesis glycosyltransferase
MSAVYLGLKRLMDIAGSLAGLLATAVLYVPIAIAIKRDSAGPVIFSQDRVGKGERIFTIHKFRTMYWNSPANGAKPNAKPTANDERVTPVGRFLRRTSMDELPQFYDVLRGNMSLVGPRPEQLPLLAHYQTWQRGRFTVKPGLTGWWQVNGRKQPMHDHIDEDIFYVKHQSLWLDAAILLRTWGAVTSGDGAE